ncbi:MAG: Lrp/AsnC family transcriptional regulator [Nanoarchaeota archaeon]|nr:Lrp/AsnC family transcriptional regulator [Nanoarchaeota archaeon]
MEQKIDKIDKKILGELDYNSRQTNAAIAKKIKASKEVVRYRIESLKKRGILENCYALIDNLKLGYQIGIVWIKFHNTTEEIERKIIKKITNSENVGMTIRLYGKWDMVLGIWSKDIFEFKKRYDKLSEEFKQYLKENLITFEMNSDYLSWDFLHDKKFKSVDIGDSLFQTKIDDIDKAIIKKLSINSRISAIEISEELSLTARAVIQRIKRLEKSGIIAGYKINVNYENLGLMHYRIFLKTLPGVDKKIRDYLKGLPRVISVMNYLGYADLEFRICIKNIKELYEIISDLKSKFGDSIVEYDSVMFLKSFEVLNFLPF